MRTNYKLKLLTWNANGISRQKLELQAILNEHRYSDDLQIIPNLVKIS